MAKNSKLIPFAKDDIEMTNGLPERSSVAAADTRL